MRNWLFSAIIRRFYLRQIIVNYQMAASRIKIQDFVPYDESIKWKINQNYYQKKGASAWLEGEVPFDITSNACAAMQNASLVLEAVKNVEKAGELAPDEPINVIEFAAGVGMFAINFIGRFKELCQNENLNYDKRLVYYFTDFSEKNLREAQKCERLREFEANGLLRFARVDVCNPALIRDLNSGEIISGIKFAAAIANYLHCVLPLTILRKNGKKFYEKQIAVSIDADKKDRDGDAAKLFLEEVDNPTGKKLWPELIEENDFREISDPDFFRDTDHLKTVYESAGHYEVATIIYPYSSFKAVKNFLALMKSGGVYIVSDKGYADPYYMYGERECKPSTHGNSIAHSVNFPLIEAYARLIGLKAFRTYNPDYSLQTLVLEKAPAEDCKAYESGAVFRQFNRLFNKENPNQKASRMMTEIMEYERDKNAEKAIGLLEEIKEIRPHDAKIYYKLGNNYFDCGKYGQARSYYRKGQDYDYFNLYDFDFEIGQCNFYMNNFDEAIGDYLLSVEKKGYNNKFAFFNTALCHSNMARFEDADYYFREALKIDPNYKRAKVNLEKNARHCKY